MNVKSIFISDVHLGCYHTLAKQLADMLEKLPNTPVYVFLVGDIFDGWKLKNNNWRWSNDASRVVKLLLEMSANGAKVVYIIGNHDEFLHKHIADYGFIDVKTEAIYQTGSKKYLVIHGDYFDSIIRGSRFIGLIGDVGYTFLLNFNLAMKKIGSIFGYYSKWSLSTFLKKNVKQVCMFVSNFDTVSTAYAKQKGCNGIICGHIHTPHTSIKDGFEYYNCGDWVEHGTLLAEYEDGTMKLLDYTQTDWNPQ